MAGIDPTRFAELLQALSSKQNQERQQAEKLYQVAKASEPDSLVLGLLAVVGNQSIDLGFRTHGAVLLRQLVAQGSEKDFVFARVSHQNRQQVAAGLLQLFEAEPNQKVQSKVGDVISKLVDSCCDEDQRGWLSPGQRGWPTLLPLVFRLANPASNPNRISCETAIRLLKDLISTLKDEVVGAQQELGALLQNAFASEEIKVKCAALLLVCEIVGIVEKKAWAPLLGTAGVLHAVLEHMARANLQDDLQECMQALVEVASVEPDFFKQRLSSAMEPANLFATLVKTRDTVDSGVRGLALEWLISYCEKRPKWLVKSLPAFAPLAVECCMEMMIEIEDGEDELKAWAQRMDDEEGEEDADEMFHTGEEAIDRVVQAVGMDAVSSGLFAAIGKFSSQEAWQVKHAALAAVKQTVEYVEDANHVSEMAKLLIQHVEHPHPRVRYTALHAIGQLANDQAPQFQEAWHATVMPLLLKKMDDPVDRVAAMAMSAFVSFGEELDNTLMLGYSQEIMQKLVGRLQSTSHRMLQEESITSIAVIAGVIEKDFSQYYDGIMPLLKRLILHATGEKESRLRGKAFECMSLLGLAVGKARFLPDAQEAIAEMMKTPIEADDMQREYIKEASERICKCLGGDFAQFLPHLLPGIFKSLRIENDDSAPAANDDDDDDEYVTVTTGEGKLVKVKSSKFEELLNSTQLLLTYCTEMEGDYFDWVPKTAEALLPLISTDEMPMLPDEARSTAYQVWALLIKSAKVGSAKRGVPSSVNELLRTFLQKACAGMHQEEDPDTVRDAADGIAECIKNAGTGSLSGQEVLQLVQQVFQFTDASFQRTAKAVTEKQAGAAGAPPELQEGEDDEDTTLDDEDNCRQSLVDALGAVMQVAPAEFLQCLPECNQRITGWLSVKQNRTLALFCGCELVKHLKEQSEPVWPTLMPAVMQALCDADAEVRIPAAYAVNLAAPLASFDMAAPEAFKRLAQIVGGPTPKKKEERARVALDNATAALLSLATRKGNLCPPEVQAWSMVIARLPLREDEEEARKVHETVVQLVLEQHAGLFENGGAHVGKALSALAEVYKQEELCTKETDQKILQVFKMLPRDNLVKLAPSFSEKQQKKIEKMLSET